MQELQEIRVTGKAARIRGATWTHDQVKKLFDVWTQPDIYQGLLNEKKKQDIFKRMASMLATQDVNRSWQECRAKMKNLKADFRRAMEKKLQFRYYDEMWRIMNLDGSATKSGISSPENQHQESDGEEPGTSSSFERELSATSPSEYITASPHHHRHTPPATSPYQHQGESDQGEREEVEDHEMVHDQDTSSKPSTTITHVVSNVIEPVTTVIMPYSSQAVPVDQSAPITHLEHDIVEQPPIRLEFVLDESENVVLQDSTSFESHEGQGQSYSSYEQSMPEATSPLLKQRLSQPDQVKTPTPPPTRTPPSTSSSPSKPVPPPPPPPSMPQRKRRPPIPDQTPEKKRKLLETLNKRTVETISNLLADSSRCLLKELQDAEQRFISWEEEKRIEERRREEAMFTKLIGAMSTSSSPSQSGSSDGARSTDKNTVGKDDDLSSQTVKDFTDMSRKLNEMVADEVKATEETVRQWEVKMQRQESRHTEKLFAMIINNIKTPFVPNET